MSAFQVHPMYRQAQAYPSAMHQVQAMQPGGYGAGAYSPASTDSRMYAAGPTFMPANHQSYGQRSQPIQAMGHPQFDRHQHYGHQTEQYLANQRLNIQQQHEQRMVVQRKIDQHKRDQLELASVRSKLGEKVCVIQNFPFKILPSNARPELYGVVKISNLPYGVTKHEIQQLLGRHAGILGRELGGGIHIIMERSTAKTMDAFVEFNNQKDAEAVARRLSFTESGRYARLGTRHVDIIVSSQDELLQSIFPRAKCIEWRYGVPNLIPNTDSYSAGFQGFLTSEEIRGLVSHALNPARSPFTERCRQRTYECLISTLWKFPWFATTMYTVGDRDELYQATMQQILDLSEKVKQRKVIGLNESLLTDLLRAGIRCPSFNERQKICLLAAAEMPWFSPVAHIKHFEFWPFDCLSKDASVTEPRVMFYAQLIRRGLGLRDIDNLSVPNNWRNRVNLVKESPWGCLWVEWNFHHKEMTFDAAAKLEMQLASDLVQAAVSVEQRQHGIQNKSTATAPIFSKPVIKESTGPLPTPWAEEAAKRGAMNSETPSHQSSDDDGLSLAIGRLRFRSGTSSTFSGGFSHIESTDGSMATNEGESKAVSQENSTAKEGNYRTRHQHSQSLSALATAAIPSVGNNLNHRRRESFSIASSVRGADYFSSISVGKDPMASAMFSPETDAKTKDASINVGTLMARHGIWSTPPSDLASYAGPGRASTNSPVDGLIRSGRASRHTSNPSLASQQGGLTVVSEDEEDIFNKSAPNKS